MCSWLSLPAGRPRAQPFGDLAVGEPSSQRRTIRVDLVLRQPPATRSPVCPGRGLPCVRLLSGSGGGDQSRAHRRGPRCGPVRGLERRIRPSCGVLAVPCVAALQVGATASAVKALGLDSLSSRAALIAARCEPASLIQIQPQGTSGEDQTALAARLSGRLDLNQRPFGPQPNALPGCATPRSGRPDSNRR